MQKSLNRFSIVQKSNNVNTSMGEEPYVALLKKIHTL